MSREAPLNARRTRRGPLACGTALLAVATLSACGFQLQGMTTPPEQMQRTYIASIDEHSLFYRKLRRELIAAGVDVVDAEESATAVFHIYFDDSAQRVLSVSARNVPTEYEVYYTVEYGVTAGDDVLLEVQDLTLTRDYTYDATLVLGKAREEELLREAIADDLVRIIFKQISAN